MYRGNAERTGYYDISDDDPECGVDMGDVTGDGVLNVLDIVTLANCVLNDSCLGLENACAADLNSDGNYNILDIVLLANIILGN